MEQIRLAYGLPKESVTTIIMLYKNLTAMILLPDGNTEFFDIVSGVLLGDILVLYLFIICLDCILQMSIDLIKKKKWFQIKKARSRRYLTAERCRLHR